MTSSVASPAPTAEPRAASRRPWAPPAITPLPPLERLTLQTDIGGLCDPLDGCTFSLVAPGDAPPRA